MTKNSIFVYLTGICVLIGAGNCFFHYDKETDRTLCRNQCNALCLESQHRCSIGLLRCSAGNETSKAQWLTNCDIPNCVGTCNTLAEHFDYTLVPAVPNVTLEDVTGSHVVLSWTPSNSVFIVYYVVQMRPVGQSIWTNVISEARLTRYPINIPDICGQYDLRVMAINEFGSKGFSLPLRVSKFLPGPIPNVSYVGGGMYYVPSSEAFMGIIEWNSIPDWNETDVQLYYWNPNPDRHCRDVNQNLQPIFRNVTAGKNRVLMQFSDDAFGCTYITQVRAVSKCGVPGIWTNFTVDLAIKPPGQVKNVTIGADRGGQKVMIKLHWAPPSDLGTMGMVDHYIIRWGQVEMFCFPEQPIFINAPNVTEVPGNSIEFDVQVERDAVYGFQIIPVAPNQQKMRDNEFGLFYVYAIRVSRSGHISNDLDGTVLLDDFEVRVMKIPNALGVDVSWHLPQTRNLPDNKTNVFDRYAVQWGKLEPQSDVANDSRLLGKNCTFLSSNKSSVTLPVNETDVFYGVQIMGLGEGDILEDDDWDDVPLHIFKIPDPGGHHTTPSSDVGHKTLYIILPILAVTMVICVGAVLKYVHAAKRRKFSHLEVFRNLSGETSNFYNNVQQQFRSNVLTPLMVPDKWEVPHSSVKVGRILGYGAFGQVVKGRISKSVLSHRGVQIPRETRTGSTYISVAVKMLQEDSEIAYKEDFLREINLMKTIGFHPHVVNMLGCCTLHDPVCLIVENVPYGDLLTYLKKIRQTVQNREVTEGHYVNKDVDILSPIDLLSFARQIAIGMEFLSQKGFVHRDLAARNILVGYNKTVKIGDFGLTRYIYNDKIYINRKGGRLPLKWMSIEAIFELMFSTASDVWSFGVVLFEIVTLGGTPYPTMDPRDILKELRQGYRMEKPDNCSQQLYAVMLRCWEEHPDKRPTFSILRDILEDMIEETSGVEYLHFRLDDNKNYYNVETDDNFGSGTKIEPAGSDSDNEDEYEEDEELDETNASEIKRSDKHIRFNDVTEYIPEKVSDFEDGDDGEGETNTENIFYPDGKPESGEIIDTDPANAHMIFAVIEESRKGDKMDFLDISQENENDEYNSQDTSAQNIASYPEFDTSDVKRCLHNSEIQSTSLKSTVSDINDTEFQIKAGVVATDNLPDVIVMDKDIFSLQNLQNEFKSSNEYDSPPASHPADSLPVNHSSDSPTVSRSSDSSSSGDDDVFLDDNSDQQFPDVCQRFTNKTMPFYTFRRQHLQNSSGYGSGSSHTSLHAAGSNSFRRRQENECQLVDQVYDCKNGSESC